MAKKKKSEGGLVCVAGCSVNGKRVKPGEPMPADADDNTVRRLVAMGRFSDADDVVEEVVNDDDKKTSGSGADKLPGVA